MFEQILFDAQWYENDA